MGPGMGMGMQAMAGLNTITGFADRIPFGPFWYAFPDTTANPGHAMTAAANRIAALLASVRRNVRIGVRR